MPEFQKSRAGKQSLNGTLFKKEHESHSVVTLYYQFECIYAKEYQLYVKDLIPVAFIYTLK